MHNVWTLADTRKLEKLSQLCIYMYIYIYMYVYN